MRLQIKISPKESYQYENDYHYHLQSAIYAMIRDGGLPNLHEQKGYKFFCFSNIYPYGDFKKGTEKSLLISSPNPSILDSIERAALARIKSNDAFLLGNYKFDITHISKPFRINLQGDETIVRSATPIVIRIPKARFNEYGIKPKVDYDYVFWRETIPLEAFVKQLRDNIAKKAKEYRDGRRSDSKIKLELSCFNERVLLPEVISYKFIRSVAKPILVKGGRQTIIGSIWDISFLIRDADQMHTLEIAIDSGFGERNSLGFGFVNAARAESISLMDRP